MFRCYQASRASDRISAGVLASLRLGNLAVGLGLHTVSELPFFPVAVVVLCPFTWPFGLFVNEFELATDPFFPEIAEVAVCEALPSAFKFVCPVR